MLALVVSAQQLMQSSLMTERKKLPALLAVTPYMFRNVCDLKAAPTQWKHTGMGLIGILVHARQSQRLLGANFKIHLAGSRSKTATNCDSC